MDEIKENIEKLFSDEASRIEKLFDFEKITKFYNFLKDENIRGGFFSKKDSDNILERHIIESLYHVYRIVEEKSVSRETKLADVGTGPGLPGFLFFCLMESPVVTLIDSQKRKLGLLENFCKKEDYKKVKFIYNRAEDIQAEKFDFVVTRSSIPFPWSVEICVKLVKDGGYFIPFLGKINNLKKDEPILEKLGFLLEKNIQLDALSFLGTRHIIFLKKAFKFSKGYPRSWKIIKEEMRHNGENRLD